jgi:type IV secretory pathway VirB2 component (pilin)
MSVATWLISACSGFLLAVLWMDLIFDAQVLAHSDAGDELPESVLASIAAYYRRAVTGSRPMSRVIAVVMVVLLGALGFRVARGHDPGWLVVVSAVLAVGPILLALTRTVPNAVRLGARSGSLTDQTRLARSIWRDHLLCAGCMLAFLVLWVANNEAV